MSVSLLAPCSALPSSQSLLPRKRTSSFSYQSLGASNPRPAKAPRLASMGALRRTESCQFLDISPSAGAGTSTPTPQPQKSEVPAVPYRRSLQYQQDQRNLRRQLAAEHVTSDTPTAIPARTLPLPQSRSLSRQQAMSTIPPQLPCQHAAPTPVSYTPPPVPKARTSRSRSASRSPKSHSSPSSRRNAAPLRAPAQVILPSATSTHAVAIVTTYRTSSPLSPVRTVLPGRPIFPRSKVEPDLYKKALISRLKQSEEGKRMVSMGPRLAISIWSATKELAKIVEDQERRDMDLDIIMGDDDSNTTTNPAPLTNSWVVVQPNEDWEMVDCAA